MMGSLTLRDQVFDENGVPCNIVAFSKVDDTELCLSLIHIFFSSFGEDFARVAPTLPPRAAYPSPLGHVPHLDPKARHGATCGHVARKGMGREKPPSGGDPDFIGESV